MSVFTVIEKKIESKINKKKQVKGSGRQKLCSDKTKKIVYEQNEVGKPCDICFRKFLEPV